MCCVCVCVWGGGADPPLLLALAEHPLHPSPSRDYVSPFLRALLLLPKGQPGAVEAPRPDVLKQPHQGTRDCSHEECERRYLIVLRECFNQRRHTILCEPAWTDLSSPEGASQSCSERVLGLMCRETMLHVGCVGSRRTLFGVQQVLQPMNREEKQQAWVQTADHIVSPRLEKQLCKKMQSERGLF